LKKEEKDFSLKDLEMFLQNQNIEYNHKFLKKFFKEISSQSKKNLKDPKVNFMGLKSILLEFSLKYEIQDIFKQYSENSQDSIIKWEKKTMSKNEFNDFLKDMQNEKISISKEKHKFSLSFSDEDSLSFFEFCQFLFNPKNSIFNPEMSQLFQDMNHPLYDYFINSSHNTYLLGNQLTGESSIQAYVNAFNKGCRCVEIDCWDGPKNTPIVTHGNTLTSKITFESVVKCINDYAFQNNPYPLTLSLENHCSIDQQDQMVEIMERIFGEKIYKPDLNEKFSYKSPNDLKYKILIKCKGLNINQKPNEAKDEADFKIKIGKVMLQSNFVFEKCENFDPEEDDLSIINHSVPIFEPKFRNWIDQRFQKNDKTSLPTIMNSFKNDNKRLFSSEEQIKSINKRIFISEDNMIDLILKEQKAPDTINENSIIMIPNEKINIPNFTVLFEENQEEKECQIKPKCLSPSNDNIKTLKRENKSRASQLLSFLVSPKHSKKNKNSEMSANSENSSKSTIIQKEKSQNNISVRLHECLGLFGYKLKTFEKQIKAYEIASFSEKKLQRYLSKEYVSIIETNKKSFTRVYPKGIRVDSSNYDPIPGFVCGVQFVALNFQTHDLNLCTYLSIFQKNGGVASGYVLKPDVLRNKILDERISLLYNKTETKVRKSVMDVFNPFKSNEGSKRDTIKKDTILNVSSALELNIQLISGFQILNDNGKLLKEPYYVEIYVKGFPNDEVSNKKFISNYQENSFHPIFDKVSLDFTLIFPELAHLIFIIYKKSSKAVAFYSIPVDCIREGYRRVPLVDFSFHEINGSYLFCKIKKKETACH